jgi:apolipoprotein N-acyltransferase
MPASKPPNDALDGRPRHGFRSTAGRRAAAVMLAGLVHGILMTLAFPTVGFWPAALLALLPLVWVAGRLEREAGRMLLQGSNGRDVTRRMVRTALLTTIAVMPLYIYQLQWLIPVTAVGYVPMAFGMGLFAGAFVWLVAELRLRLPAAPMAVSAGLVWTALEVFRGEVAFSGYAWFFVAHPLIDAPILPLPAAVLGTYFVLFLVAAAAGAAGDLFSGRWAQQRAGALAMVSIGAAFMLCAILPRGGGEGPLLRVAVIQTNVPQDNKVAWTIERKLQDFERFMELTREAAFAEPRPDLIIWPESMFPDALDPQAVAEQRGVGLIYNLDQVLAGRTRMAATEFHDRLLALHMETGITMLIGAVGLENLRIKEDERGRIIPSIDGQYNSMILIADGAVQPTRYDKLRLTPFGEVMPYINAWPWLERQLMAIGAQGMRFDLSPGSVVRTMRVSAGDGTPVGVATPICFEVTKPRLTGMLVRNIPDDWPRFIVNATNDGWFGNFESGRAQHLQIARWRSLEQGVPMLRAANTGISAWIDARGRVLQAGPDNGSASHSDGVLSADLRPTIGRTIYGRTGDIFAGAVLAAGGGVCLVGFARPRRRAA